MTRKLTELAADIIQAQASHARMSGEEISDALMKTFETLRKMKIAEDNIKDKDIASSASIQIAKMDTLSVQKKETIPLDAKDSIQRSKVICMECGAEFKQLSANHLKSHGLTLREYKKKYGFPLSQPLSAKSLTTKRKKLGKKRGLPPQLIEARKKKTK